MEMSKEIEFILLQREILLEQIKKTASPNIFLSGYLCALDSILIEFGVEYK